MRTVEMLKVAQTVKVCTFVSFQVGNKTGNFNIEQLKFKCSSHGEIMIKTLTS